MTTKTFSHALGEIGDKYVSEAISYTFSKKKNGWMKWGAMAACLCLVVLVGIKIGTRDNFIPLNINTITSASFSAPAITSTIESVQVTEDDVNAWLGFDLRSNLPKEIKDFSMKYYLVRDSEIDETLGVEVWGKVEDAEIPRPQFHITITEGKVLEGLLFDYDVTTDIDGVTVIAGVMPGEYNTKRDGDVVWQPARYFSLFDVGVYHCTVETQGQVSEDAFSELNNVLVDLLLEKLDMFEGNSAQRNDKSKQTIILPSGVNAVEVSGYYNGGVINAGDFVVADLETFATWISQLSLEHRTFEESKTPGEMYAGWNSYIFEINDGELTFTYNDGGTMTYIIYDEEWYEVLNPSELPFE